MDMYYFILCIGLATTSTSHCAFIVKDKLTNPIEYEKPYDIWTGAKIPIERYSESNTARSRIGPIGKSIHLPPFTFFSNPIEQFTSGRNFRPQNEPSVIYYKNEMRIEAPVQQNQNPSRNVFQENSNNKSNTEDAEQRSIGKHTSLKQENKYISSHQKSTRNGCSNGNGFVDKSKVSITSCKPSQEIETEGTKASIRKIENPLVTQVSKVAQQETHSHESLVLKAMSRSETLHDKGSQSDKGLLTLGKDKRRIENQIITPSSKEIARSRDTRNKQAGMPDIRLLQRYGQLKSTEVINAVKNVEVNLKVESGIPESKETRGESTRKKTTVTLKNDTHIQNNGLPKTPDACYKVVQDKRNKNEKNTLEESINRNLLQENKFDQSRSVCAEERKESVTKKPLNIQQQPPWNERHGGSLNYLENEYMRTSIKSVQDKGSENREIDVALKEAPPPLALLKDFDPKAKQPPQHQDQAAVSSSQDPETTEQESVSQEDAIRNEMHTEALISPQSVSISTSQKLIADAGEDDEGPNSYSSSDDSANLEEKHTFQKQDEGGDGLDQRSSGISQPSQVKGVVRKKATKKSKKAKNKKSKSKAKAKDLKQDESESKIEEPIKNIGQNDESLQSSISLDHTEDFSQIDKQDLLKDVIKSKDQTPMLKIVLSTLQFEYLRSMGFGSDTWKTPFANLQMKFDDPYEAYRRISSVQRQFYAIKVTYVWKEEGEKLSPQIKEMADILQFAEPFPDFQGQNFNQLTRLYDLSDEVDVEQIKVLRGIAEWQFEKRLSTLFMMVHNDVYRQSRVLQDALSRDLVKEGYILPILANIDYILELSSNTENWKDLKKEQIQEKVHQLLGVMCGFVKLNYGEKFQVFKNTWKEEPTRKLFTMNDDKTSKTFAIRIKYLASLADKMNVGFPETHQIEGNHPQKIISVGECLIAQHVGLSVELLRKFKIWLNFKESRDKMKSQVIGLWKDVPKEFSIKGPLFKEYFDHRYEKVKGLENWNQQCEKVLVFDAVENN